MQTLDLVLQKWVVNSKNSNIQQAQKVVKDPCQT